MPEHNVVLVAGDGKEFTITRQAANFSRTLRDMMHGMEHLGGAAGDDDDAAPSPAPRFELEDFDSPVLDLVCQYLNQKAATGNTMAEFPALKQLDPKKEEDRQTVLELLLAADYLDC